MWLTLTNIFSWMLSRDVQAYYMYSMFQTGPRVSHDIYIHLQ